MSNSKAHKALFYLSAGLYVFNNNKIVRLLGDFLYFIMPAIVILIVGFCFFYGTVDQKYSNEQYKILIGAFGFTATLSGLSFRAKNSTKNQIKEEIFYDSAEKFLHSTILLAFATLFKYATSELEKIQPIPLINFVIILLKVSAAVSFMYGIVYCTVYLCFLNFMLFNQRSNLSSLDLFNKK